jgi:hypothetical protein
MTTREEFIIEELLNFLIFNPITVIIVVVCACCIVYYFIRLLIYVLENIETTLNAFSPKPKCDHDWEIVGTKEIDFYYFKPLIKAILEKLKKQDKYLYYYLRPYWDDRWYVLSFSYYPDHYISWCNDKDYKIMNTQYWRDHKEYINRICLKCEEKDLEINDMINKVMKQTEKDITEALNDFMNDYKQYKQKEIDKVKEAFIKEERQKLAKALLGEDNINEYN